MPLEFSTCVYKCSVEMCIRVHSQSLLHLYLLEYKICMSILYYWTSNKLQKSEIQLSFLIRIHQYLLLCNSYIQYLEETLQMVISDMMFISVTVLTAHCTKAANTAALHSSLQYSAFQSGFLCRPPKHCCVCMHIPHLHRPMLNLELSHVMCSSQQNCM